MPIHAYIKHLATLHLLISVTDNQSNSSVSSAEPLRYIWKTNSFSLEPRPCQSIFVRSSSWLARRNDSKCRGPESGRRTHTSALYYVSTSCTVLRSTIRPSHFLEHARYPPLGCWFSVILALTAYLVTFTGLALFSSASLIQDMYHLSST